MAHLENSASSYNGYHFCSCHLVMLLCHQKGKSFGVLWKTINRPLRVLSQLTCLVQLKQALVHFFLLGLAYLGEVKLLIEQPRKVVLSKFPSKLCCGFVCGEKKK